MKGLHFQGRPLNDNASKVCVLYDPHDGRVVHVHGVTTTSSQNHVYTNDQLEDRTILHAKAFGHSVDKLRVLHVPLSAIQQSGPLEVD